MKNIHRKKKYLNDVKRNKTKSHKMNKLVFFNKKIRIEKELKLKSISNNKINLEEFYSIIIKELNLTDKKNNYPNLIISTYLSETKKSIKYSLKDIDNNKLFCAFFVVNENIIEYCGYLSNLNAKLYNLEDDIYYHSKANIIDSIQFEKSTINAHKLLSFEDEWNNYNNGIIKDKDLSDSLFNIDFPSLNLIDLMDYLEYEQKYLLAVNKLYNINNPSIIGSEVLINILNSIEKKREPTQFDPIKLKGIDNNLLNQHLLQEKDLLDNGKVHDFLDYNGVDNFFDYLEPSFYKSETDLFVKKTRSMIIYCEFIRKINSNQKKEIFLLEKNTFSLLIKSRLQNEESVLEYLKANYILKSEKDLHNNKIRFSLTNNEQKDKNRIEISNQLLNTFYIGIEKPSIWYKCSFLFTLKYLSGVNVYTRDGISYVCWIHIRDNILPNYIAEETIKVIKNSNIYDSLFASISDCNRKGSNISLIKYEAILNNKEIISNNNLPDIETLGQYFPLCISELEKKTHLFHNQRIDYASVLLSIGYNEEDIYKKMEKFNTDRNGKILSQKEWKDIYGKVAQRSGKKEPFNGSCKIFSEKEKVANLSCPFVTENENQLRLILKEKKITDDQINDIIESNDKGNYRRSCTLFMYYSIGNPGKREENKNYPFIVKTPADFTLKAIETKKEVRKNRLYKSENKEIKSKKNKI